MVDDWRRGLRLGFVAGVLALMMIGLSIPTTAHAQNVAGVFSWRLLPFCNVFTFTVAQFGPFFLVTGQDNACGNSLPRPVTGTIVPSGALFQLAYSAIVPGNAAHFFVVLDGSLSGPWTNTLGQTGTFAFLGGGGRSSETEEVPSAPSWTSGIP
jgi:hypothetical protein